MAQGDFLISRGYFIGEIIDDLTGIAGQVDNRCMLGLTDINRFLENFFREILNVVLGTNLVNLNADRSNEPGLDLGDQGSRIAFQVTSVKTSTKVNGTLEKLTQAQLDDYDKIHVLVIGTKQSSYTLDLDLCKKARFTKADIWDIRDICKKAMDLPLDELRNLYDYVKAEVVRVKIELEVANPEGKFPTSLLDYIESIPKPQLSDFTKYHQFHKELEDAYELTPEEVKADFAELTSKLARLPRITREFYAFLLEHRDPERGGYFEYSTFRFNYDRLLRICRYSDMEGELRLLNEEGLADINPPDDADQSPYVRIFVPAIHSQAFHYELTAFAEHQKSPLRKPLVTLDFSDF